MIINIHDRLTLVFKYWKGVWAIGVTIEEIYTTWGTDVRNVNFHLLPFGMTLKFKRYEQDEAWKE